MHAGEPQRTPWSHWPHMIIQRERIPVERRVTLGDSVRVEMAETGYECDRTAREDTHDDRF